MHRLLHSCAAALLLAGCASSGFTPSGERTFEPHGGAVQVLEQLPPQGSYHLVGIVTVSGVALTSDERMMRQAKELAADHGADSIVLQRPIRDRPAGDGGEERTLAAYAIRQRR